MKKLLTLIVFSFIITGCGNNNQTNSTNESPKKELTLNEILAGNYLQKPSSNVEVFTVLTIDNKYYQKTIIDGEDRLTDKGTWKIIELSTKSLTDKRTSSFILFDDKFILQIINDCFALPKRPFGDIAWEEGYLPPESSFVSSMNLSPPFNILDFTNECIKKTSDYKDIFNNLFKELLNDNKSVNLNNAVDDQELNIQSTNSDFYIIAVDIASSETEAKEKVDLLKAQGYESDFLWIPDYKSLSGAEYFSVFIGPISSIDECALKVENYRKSNPSAYGLLVSNESSKRVEIRGPDKIKIK